MKVGDRVYDIYGKNEGKVIEIDPRGHEPIATVVWDHSPDGRDYWYVADLREVKND